MGSSVQRLAAQWLMAKGRAKKDVGHGGLDEWFSGHGKGKSKSKGKARWGDWVAITPVKRTITREDGTKKTYEPGDIVGPCGISKTKEWKEFTRGGKDPLKCMPRQKAYDMPKAERAQLAKGKLKAERKEKETKAPTRTRTFKKKKKAGESRSTCNHEGCSKAPEVDVLWADGRGRAWFCKPHLKSWKAEKTEMPRDIVREVEVDGEVPPKMSQKKAKSSGRKTGDGSSAGLFIPLPKHLAKKFPSLGEEDSSPSHVTFMILGDIRKKKDVVMDVLRGSLRRIPKGKATLGKLEYFDHRDKDRRVPHLSVKFDKALSDFRTRLMEELKEAGISVEDRYPDFRPHVTLAYLPGMDSKWEGKIPKGSWGFDEMELWGAPKVHRLKLGPSIRKVSEAWLRQASSKRLSSQWAHRRFVAAAKTAGWWSLDGKPPVDKGALMNAIPGTDPANAAMYNGDEPADHTGKYLDQIDIIYRTVWGRPAHPQELQAVFDFCFRPVEDGALKLNQWFDGFVAWLGIPATEIRWSLEVWDQLSWFFLQVKNQEFWRKPLPDVWKTLGVVKDDLKRLNDLEYAFDSTAGTQFHDAVVAKLKMLKEYWLDTMFPKESSPSSMTLVKNVAQKWLGEKA